MEAFFWFVNNLKTDLITEMSRQMLLTEMVKLSIKMK